MSHDMLGGGHVTAPLIHVTSNRFLFFIFFLMVMKSSQQPGVLYHAAAFHF